MITNTTGVFKLQELPPLDVGESRYVMASNGIFYEQNDDLFHGSDTIHEFYRPVNFGAMKLLEHEAFFVPKFPVIPASMISQCLGFFKAIEDKHDTECGLVLLYDPDLRQYHWCCPEQECSSWDLKFTTPIPGKDYEENLIHFGDIHLHPGMSAYHSTTDEKDEMTASDGLHIVVGTKKAWGHWEAGRWISAGKNDVNVEFCAVFVSDGARFKVDPAAVMEVTDQSMAFPPSWLKKCHVKKNKANWLGGTETSVSVSGSTKKKSMTDHFKDVEDEYDPKWNGGVKDGY